MHKEINMANWNWKSRYVDPASRIDITECHSRLRWLQSYDIPCSPLLKWKNSFQLNWINASSQKYKLEVLHLFRCFTHTPRCHEDISCNKCTRCRAALIRSLRRLDLYKIYLLDKTQVTTHRHSGQALTFQCADESRWDHCWVAAQQQPHPTSPLGLWAHEFSQFFHNSCRSLPSYLNREFPDTGATRACQKTS